MLFLQKKKKKEQFKNNNQSIQRNNPNCAYSFNFLSVHQLNRMLKRHFIDENIVSLKKSKNLIVLKVIDLSHDSFFLEREHMLPLTIYVAKINK